MKLTNTTTTPTIPDHAIRRMTSYCCRVLGIPAREITDLTIRNRSDGSTSGRCWLRTGRIVCSVGYILSERESDGAVRCPDDPGLYRHTDDWHLRLRMDKLLGVLAHEVAHRATYLQGTAKGPRNGHAGCSEKDTQWHANIIMRAFWRDRDSLLDRWLQEPKRPERAAARAAKDPRQQRAEKDAELLKTWQRKLALAKTKVAKYKRKVARAKRETS